MDHWSATVSPQGWCNLCELLIIFSVDSQFQLDACWPPPGIAVVTSFLLCQSCLSEGAWWAVLECQSCRSVDCAGMMNVPPCWMCLTFECVLCCRVDSSQNGDCAELLTVPQCWFCHNVDCAGGLIVPQWWHCQKIDCAAMFTVPKDWLCRNVDYARIIFVLKCSLCWTVNCAEMLLAYTAVNRLAQSILQQDPHPSGQEGGTINISAPSSVQPSQHSGPVNNSAPLPVWQSSFQHSPTSVAWPACSTCARMMNVPPYWMCCPIECAALLNVRHLSMCCSIHLTMLDYCDHAGIMNFLSLECAACCTLCGPTSHWHNTPSDSIYTTNYFQQIGTTNHQN